MRRADKDEKSNMKIWLAKKGDTETRDMTMKGKESQKRKTKTNLDDLIE